MSRRLHLSLPNAQNLLSLNFSFWQKDTSVKCDTDSLEEMRSLGTHPDTLDWEMEIDFYFHS